MTEDSRVIARTYYRKPPALAVVVDAPWWWAVLAGLADLINIPFDPRVWAGPLAIVARDQRPLDHRRDCDAIEAILKAQGKPTFDAWRCPTGKQARIVGLVTVDDIYDDQDAEGHWFSGPFALSVTKPMLLERSLSTNIMDRDRFVPLTSGHQQSIQYELTAMANGLRRQ